MILGYPLPMHHRTMTASLSIAARHALLAILALSALAALALATAAEAPADGTEAGSASGCLRCHKGIEPIAPEKSPMMVQVHMLGRLRGDPAGCVVCHGGNPQARTADQAHRGAPKVSKHCQCPTPEAFYPDPGALDVAEHTCGQCHRGYVARLQRSLMATEAGKINATIKTPAPPPGALWGNRSVEDSDGPEPAVGTSAYKRYMQALMETHPAAFATRLTALPHPQNPTSTAHGTAEPLARYWRACDGCHLHTEGRGASGEFRGRGCSACHMPYAADARYAGADPTIDRRELGHALTHTLQGTRKTQVHYAKSSHTGISMRTCNTCHGREAAYLKTGLRPSQTVRRLDDRHHAQALRGQGLLLCQDCHTSNEVHGDGNIAVTLGAQAEVRCADCHGTEKAYPWELPLGFGDPFQPGADVKMKGPRGLAQHLQKVTSWWATRYPKADGYLMSSRGNPLGNVVKEGRRVVLHSATGKDFEVPLFKKTKDAP